MELSTIINAVDSLASVSILLIVLWLWKQKTDAEIVLIKEILEKRIEELTVDRNFYRDKYSDGEAMKEDRDWYRDRLERSTNILGNLLSTVEVEEVER
jgi:hypothetical protein